MLVCLASFACSVGARGSNATYAYKLYCPDVTTSFVVDAAASTLQYNHDAAIALFDDHWIVMWNANTMPIEGHEIVPAMLQDQGENSSESPNLQLSQPRDLWQYLR